MCPGYVLWDFTSKVDPDWINRSSVIMPQFSLLCSDGSDKVSSCDVPLGLFDRGLSDVGILGVAGVHFDVSGGGLVWTGSRLLVSVDTGNGDQFPRTTTKRSLTGGSECCGWLQFLTRGGGACGSSNRHARAHRRAQPGRRGGMYLDCVHSAGISYSSTVPGSLLLQFLLCYLIVVSVRSCLSFEGKQGCCEESLSGSLCRLEYYTRTRRCAMTVCIANGAMASSDSGDSRPQADRRRVIFRNELQTTWNAPESYAALDSPGVVEQDTSVVSDVLGLRARYQNAGPTGVLPGRA